MAKLMDLEGQRFGRLLVVSNAGRRGGSVWWSCLCDCGSTKEVRSQLLRLGMTKSCGCFRVECGYARTAVGGEMDTRKHGMWRTPEYIAWRSICGRCKTPKEQDRRNYGDRGIAICERWRDSFENFFADMGFRPSSGHSIDRKDNDGPYSPENCRWATRKEQQRNTRVNRRITYDGKTLCIAEWAELTGLRWQTIMNRINAGKLPAEILAPVRRRVA